MSDRLTVHAWGFFDSEGRPRIVDGVAVSAETPGEVITRVRANIVHHGGTCTETHTVRTMDGWLVGADWETPERDDRTAARMWHKVMQESDAWPAPTVSTPDEQSVTRRDPSVHTHDWRDEEMGS